MERVLSNQEISTITARPDRSRAEGLRINLMKDAPIDWASWTLTFAMWGFVLFCCGLTWLSHKLNVG